MTLYQQTLALLPLREPSPVGYMNLYEPGDLWEKVRGCDDCPAEQREQCCGACPMGSQAGCFLHMSEHGDNKPFHCVVHPVPTKHRPNCVLAYRCIEGQRVGLLRRACDPGNVFWRDGQKVIIDA